MTVKLITKAGKYGTSKSEMIAACEKYAQENDCHFDGLNKHHNWAWEANFTKDGDEFSGVMIAVSTDNPDWSIEADVLFGWGQQVGSKGQYTVEKEEYFDELGMGD